MKTPAGLSLVAGWTDELRALYAIPERHYHSFAHVAEVLEQYWTCTWETPNEVFAALLFHDAIYVPGAPDNEARSADLAVEILPRWTQVSLDLSWIHRLILLTQRHGGLTRADVTKEEARFLDCDMAILAASDTRFASYEKQVAAEYAFLSPDAYRAGRRAFLEKLLASKHIYLSDYFRNRYEARARTNLARALERFP